MGCPDAVHAEAGLQGDRLRELPGDGGPRDAGACAHPWDPAHAVRRAGLPRGGRRSVPEGATGDPGAIPRRDRERPRRDLLRKELRQKIFVGEPGGETFATTDPEQRIETLRQEMRQGPTELPPAKGSSKKGQTKFEDF